MSEEVETVGKPDLVVSEDVYRFAWDSVHIEAEVERISEKHDELTAEVTIRSARDMRPGLLHSARLNLMSTQARKTLVGTLNDREPDIDWPALVEQMCFLTRERYRTGEPSIDLRKHTPSAAGLWLLEPFVLTDGACVVFADGGTGKSYFAQAVSVSIASGVSVIGKLHGGARPVLYLDWETSADTARYRVEAIARGAGISPFPAVHYRRQYASLAESATEIRREIRRLGAGFVVVDSQGAARAGEPESAEVTIRMFNAARSLGVPWMGIDHVTKASGNDATRPFGSTFAHNLARLTWSLDKSQETGSASGVVGLKNQKFNDGRALPSIAYNVQYVDMSDGRPWTVTYERTDPGRTALASRMVGVKARIAAELGQAGKLDPAELPELLGVSPHVCRSRISELRHEGRIRDNEDGTISLLAQTA